MDTQFGKIAVLDAKLQSLKDENETLIGAQIERDESISNYKQKIHKIEVSNFVCLFVVVVYRFIGGARRHEERALRVGSREPEATPQGSKDGGQEVGGRY